MRKNRISKNWINKQSRDIYVRKSKVEGYRSRAVYKLKEINNKFKIIKNGYSVLDLGLAPGSWSQFISRNFKNCRLLGIDLLDVETIDNVCILKGDFKDLKNQNKIEEFFYKGIDTIISNMAVNTTGNKNIDSIVTGDLAMEAMGFATNKLKKDGQFVSKIFIGSSFKEIVSMAKKNFKETHIFKPLSSRKDSKESFIVCKKLR